MSKRKPKQQKQAAKAAITSVNDVGMVTLRLPVAQAEHLQLGMADLLCWCAGFSAACPDQFSRHPQGVNEARELRMALNRALRDTIGAAHGDELDF